MGKFRELIRKVSYSVAANLISMAVSVLVTLSVPAFLGEDIAGYGFYQYFVFYAGYVGFLHFGLCDGILLREAGKEYGDLDREVYSGEFWILCFTEIFFSIIIAGASLLFAPDGDRRFIWIFVAVNVVVIIPKYMLSYILQATGRVKEYSILTAAGRLAFGIAVIFFILRGVRDYRGIIAVQTAGEGLSLILSVIFCRDLVFVKRPGFAQGLKKAETDIGVGCKLLFANIAGLLVTGVVRFGIQTGFDIETYGKVSFTLTISNLLLMLISAVELVLYPEFRRTEEEKLPGIYSKLHGVLMPVLYGSMVLYYPAELVLTAFLPQYADAVRYVAILFPVCVFSAKMNLLVQNYMKVFRMEREILRVNVVGMLIAVVTTVISVALFHNLTLAMVAVVVNHGLRCIYGEYLLSERISIRLIPYILWEVIMTAGFILSMWCVGGWPGTAIYLAGFAVYMFFNRKASE